MKKHTLTRNQYEIDYDEFKRIFIGYIKDTYGKDVALDNHFKTVQAIDIAGKKSTLRGVVVIIDENSSTEIPTND